jgi:chromosomal replication initiator protein
LSTLWSACLKELEHSLPPQQLTSWVLPLKAIEQPELHKLQLIAPNDFALQWVRDKLWEHIQDALTRSLPTNSPAWRLSIDVGQFAQVVIDDEPKAPGRPEIQTKTPIKAQHIQTGLNSGFTFDNFVEGKANQLANAAARQVASNPGGAYNPLFIYGGVGLGKTHIMHAIGNQLVANNPQAKVVYMPSERFVQDMVTAIRHNKMEEFKKFYRSLDALLIDDIQFFATGNKTGSQEEFFHTFNALLEGNKQVIMTSDRYPKEIDGLEERLKSRFGWGLAIAVEPPEFEMRVAILMKKASLRQVHLPENVAFLIANNLRANVRELEGALNRVLAYSGLMGRPLTMDVAKEALKDLIALQARTLTLENIQKTVADFFNLRVSDLTSAKRTRTITRPRQIAMYISKELTGHSLPEIGDIYGGRDHTTVLHACRQVAKLREEDASLNEDVSALLHVLTA